LSVATNETTSLNLQQKSHRTATIKSKIAGSKKKSSNAVTSTSEEPPSPEDGTRKCPSEELVEEEKPKRKVTTLWSRGKAKRVVIVDLPKGKDTGPPSNENGVSFCKQCNVICISSSSTSRKKETCRKSIADLIQQSAKKKCKTTKPTKTPEEERVDLEGKDVKDRHEGKV